VSRRARPRFRWSRFGGRGRGARLLPRLAALLLVLAALVWASWAYLGPTSRAQGSVIIPKGAGASAIAAQLAHAGVIRSQLLFIAAAKLRGGSLKAGEYAFPHGASMARVLSDLRAGRVIRHFITIPEGWTSEMAAAAVAKEPELTGPVSPPAEGALLPETYEFTRGEPRTAVLDRMHQAQVKLLAKLWPARQADLPFATPEEALALASIVEKETALPQERPRIAAVYINRLRHGIRLVSDPTTIYGVSRGRPLGRGLTRAELAAATPYNTYQVVGLPPTPIANPGRAAIAAVLNPPKTDELFFVANGQGGHAFAANFAEHQRNVARWREIERGRAPAAAPAPRKAG
jgi:UPF0755 protein